MTTTSQLQHRVRGFTLIEVLITLAIVAILTAIAVPNYSEYVRRSHRSNARTALLAAAQWMERAATAGGAYPLTVAIPAGFQGNLVEGGRYRVAGVSDGATFSFTATPELGTPQIADKCGTFALDQAGRKTVGGVATLTALECWTK